LVDPILRQTEEPPLLHEFNKIRGIPVTPGGMVVAGDGFGRIHFLRLEGP
jgi:hypothetical protein